MADASEFKIFSRWKIHDPRKRSSECGEFFILSLQKFGPIYSGKRILKTRITGSRVVCALQM
jgi:hypothetical protein